MHLVLAVDSFTANRLSAAGRFLPAVPRLEAFTSDVSFVQEVADYRSGDESEYSSSGDRVEIEGEFCDGKAATLRLEPSVPLVKLKSIVKAGTPGSRADVGKRRNPDSIDPAAKLAPLAEILRMPPAEPRTFSAIYQGWDAGSGVRVAAGPRDRRSVTVQFPSVSRGNLADYRPEETVFVEAAFNEGTEPGQLKIQGRAALAGSRPGRLADHSARAGNPAARFRRGSEEMVGRPFVAGRTPWGEAPRSRPLPFA